MTQGSGIGGSGKRRGLRSALRLRKVRCGMFRIRSRNAAAQFEIRQLKELGIGRRIRVGLGQIFLKRHKREERWLGPSFLLVEDVVLPYARW